MPKVSVVIATYNRSRFLCQTIESALSQTYKDYEIIIVDDGSTDDTKEALKFFDGKIRYFYQENQGISAAKNRGVNESVGEFIAFVDDDDIWLPEKLDEQMQFIERHPQLAFVCSEVITIDEHGNFLAHWRKPKDQKISDNFENLYDGNFIHVPTVLLRKKCFIEIGGFDEKLMTTEDYDLWLRLAKRHPFRYMDKPLAKYRIHKNQTTKNVKKLELRVRNNIKALNRREIASDLGFFKKRVRKAKVYYQYAKIYFKSENFLKASLTYFKSLATYPLIGTYYWPKEARNLRFSLVYRVLKIYLNVFLCLFLDTKNRMQLLLRLKKGKLNNA